ncbi:MAG: inositol monophosphatase [Deltaproteobacteria bacterium]|nr:inositol monophosphatase [Deltaproteobacteria bacterium]
MSERGPVTPQERLAELDQLAATVATEAAEVVMAGYRTRPVADEKGRRDLVTEFDRASEALILERLRAHEPDIEVVAEEGSRHRQGSNSPLVWYVDPLDGTTNFVHGHPFWCVAIGLAETTRSRGGKQEQPVVGAVVAPALQLTWRAHGAGPATRNGQPCQLSETASLAHSLVATGFPPLRDHVPDNNFDSFMQVKQKSQAVRRCGSAAIDLCMVADGTYEGFWERRLHVWDTVAGAAILLAAGGKVTSLTGQTPDYHVGHVVASNGFIHDELVATVGA